MSASRREFIRVSGVGLGAVALAANDTRALAQAQVQPPYSPGPSAYQASTAERALLLVNLDLLEAEAKRVLPEAGYVFVSGGSGDEWTLLENRRAFHDFPILPHRLTGLGDNDIDLRVSLLGHDLPYPILVAPIGALYESSGASNRPMEEIARATSGPKWFQLYFNNDLGVTHSLLQRAREAGHTAIILTADALGPGQSEAFISMGRPFRPGMTFGNHDPHYGGSGNFLDQKKDLTWEHVGLVREASKLPVVVKGLLRADDARQAIRAGAAAVQVSNHGGRQLDGLPASISVLPAVADAVAGQVPIILDGGVRRGIDVFRALALGANAVAVGRPILYGLAVGGSEGVRSVLQFLRDELKMAMLLAGVGRVGDIKRTSIVTMSARSRAENDDETNRLAHRRRTDGGLDDHCPGRERHRRSGPPRALRQSRGPTRPDGAGLP